MTEPIRPDSDGIDYEDLAGRFRPLFEQIAQGAAERERARELPYKEVGLLREAGFGAVRLPVAAGGGGATVDQLFRLLIELGEADSNLPQLLRAHFGFVEERLYEPESPIRARWLRAVADGALVGNASTEIGSGALGTINTTVSGADGDPYWRLDGTKHYSTGSLFADWIAVLASRGEAVGFAVVRGDAAGVAQSDDWAGFGQRMTGSGTAAFDGTRVDPADVFWYSDENPSYIIAFYQLVLLATLAGIGRAVVRDAVAYVRGRTRAFSHGSGTTAREDPLIQHTVGRLSALSFAAEATVLTAAGRLARINTLRQRGDVDRAAFDEAEITVSRAQGTVADFVLDAATALFEVGGSSALAGPLVLDRHWRNARTVATHNPTAFKVRAVGDHLLNGTAPTYSWVVGTPAGSVGTPAGSGGAPGESVGTPGAPAGAPGGPPGSEERRP